MNYIIKDRGTFSGQHGAVTRKYHEFTGKSGRIWLVADQPNAGDNIYVSNIGMRSEGFGGATLEFELINGEKIKLQGPWHSNSDSLFEDTGHDTRDKHLTFVVISKEKKYINNQIVLCDILYIDEEPVVGFFDRGKKLAQQLSNDMNEQIFLYSESPGGSSSGPVKPKL